jgi:hypothetical protein
VGGAPGQERVHGARQRIDVGRGRHARPLEHLGWGEVANGVVEGPEPGEVAELRQTDVGHQRLTRRSEHQAVGREVAMHYAGAVRGLERPRHQHADPQRLVDGERSAGLEHCVDGLGRLGVGDHPGTAVIRLAPVVDGEHARVRRQPPGGGGGVVEPASDGLVGQRGEDRDRHPPAEPVALRAVERGRQALPDRSEVATIGYRRRGGPSHVGWRIYLGSTARIHAQERTFPQHFATPSHLAAPGGRLRAPGHMTGRSTAKFPHRLGPRR